MGLKKSNKTLRRLVQARIAAVQKRKARIDDRKLIAEQKELRDYLITKKDKVRHIVQPNEILNLMDNEESPYILVRGSSLWKGLKDSWLGYKIGKRKGSLGDIEEQRRQRECAVKVQEIQSLLGVDVDDFKHIGISKAGHLNPTNIKGDYLGEDINNA